MKSKKVMFLVVTVAIVFFGYVLMILSKYFRLLNEDFKNDLETIYTLSAEDSSLIRPEYLLDLTVDEKAQSKLSFPVLMMSFQRSWQLVAFKFPVATTSLSPMLHDLSVSKRRTDRIPYRTFSQDAYKISFHPAGFQPVNRIKMTIYGDSTSKKIVNDSVISFISKCRNLSLTFNQGKIVDVHVEATGRHPVPINGVLLKKNSFLYVILLMRKDANSNIPLHKLVQVLNF